MPANATRTPGSGETYPVFVEGTGITLTAGDMVVPGLLALKNGTAVALIALGGSTRALSVPVGLSDEDRTILTTISTLASPTEVTPTQITKTVAASGTPEALASNGTTFQTAIIVAKKAARTANTGIVYLGIGSTNDTQPIELYPGDQLTITAPPGAKFDLNDWYLDVATNGDGVVVIYK